MELPLDDLGITFILILTNCIVNISEVPPKGNTIENSQSPPPSSLHHGVLPLHTQDQNLPLDSLSSLYTTQISKKYIISVIIIALMCPSLLPSHSTKFSLLDSTHPLLHTLYTRARPRQGLTSELIWLMMMMMVMMITSVCSAHPPQHSLHWHVWQGQAGKD